MQATGSTGIGCTLNMLSTLHRAIHFQRTAGWSTSVSWIDSGCGLYIHFHCWYQRERCWPSCILPDWVGHSSTEPVPSYDHKTNTVTTTTKQTGLMYMTVILGSSGALYITWLWTHQSCCYHTKYRDWTEWLWHHTASCSSDELGLCSISQLAWLTWI